MIFIFLKGLIFQRSLNGIKNNGLKRRICSWPRIFAGISAGVGKKSSVHHARGLCDIHVTIISILFTEKNIIADNIHPRTLIY